MCTRSVESKCAALLTALAVLGVADSAGAQGYPAKFDFGVPASAEDIATVAIAIRPDGQGLPAGKGDYAMGKKVYETTCSACHGENLQGVTGLPNMPSGQALRLIGGRGTLTTKNPVMTVESYWPYATTLFDYVRRAMPFQAPGSLTADEVYSVSAYILAEANIIDKTTVLDAQSLPSVQMPKEPYVRLSRIRLLPRVRTANACRMRASACDPQARL